MLATWKRSILLFTIDSYHHFITLVPFNRRVVISLGKKQTRIIHFFVYFSNFSIFSAIFIIFLS